MTSREPRDRTVPVLPGGLGRRCTASRAGYLPILLEPTPSEALEHLQIYLRSVKPDPGGTPEVVYTLYRTIGIDFTDADRQRLLDNGIKYVHIRTTDQSRFRIETERRFEAIVTDPLIDLSERATIVYETSIELIDELLSDPDVGAASPRLRRLARAITRMVIDEPSAFGHLFAVSHHDFYAATHLVNVAMWMVPAAYALGYRNEEVLSHVCLAGLLHDLGKLYVSSLVLNKREKLSAEDWRIIHDHPMRGAALLAGSGYFDPLVLGIVRQHHERLDGSGYPNGLRGEQIWPLSCLCGLIDSFDAMTAFRTYRERPASIKEALAVLKRATPQQYDPRVLQAWIGLLRGANVDLSDEDSLPPAAPAPAGKTERRGSSRVGFRCPVRVHILRPGLDGVSEFPAIPAATHNISLTGLALLCRVQLPVDEDIRVYPKRGVMWRTPFLEGRTIRCRAYPDGWYQVSVRLASPDAQEGNLAEAIRQIVASGASSDADVGVDAEAQKSPPSSPTPNQEWLA